MCAPIGQQEYCLALSDPNTTPDPVSAATPSPKMNPNKAAFLELAEAFPDLFNLQAAKPLAIGIHAQLAESGSLSKTKIRRGLGFYVRQRAYLKAVAAGGPRQGLAGPMGEVTPEESQHAQQQLAALEQMLKERRAKFRADSAPKTQPKQATQVKPKPQPAKAKTTPAPPAPKAEDPAERLNNKLNQLSARFSKGQ